MCKNPNAVIANAKRENNGGEVYALYKGAELEGICMVFNGVLAIAYDIISGDELSYYSKSSTKNVTNRFEMVRRLFGVDSGFIRPMYSVSRC